MDAESTPKYEVAVELLDWALQAFLSGSGYYAALHLAGAAEEVLAVYLRAPENKLTPAVERFASLFLHISASTSQQEAANLSKWVMDRMNEPRNSVKHKRGHSDHEVTFDAEEEAADVIDRAVSNYTLLLGKLPLKHLPAIGTFDQARRTKRSTARGDDAQ
jgi:hypothetical protein